jgi:hypothetical protein
MATAPDLEVEITLRLLLSSDRTSKAAHWDWPTLLGLSAQETVEVTAQRAKPYEPTLPADLPDFDGVTYQPEFDEERLGNQMKAVYEIMADGVWRTLDTLAAEAEAPPASVSARIRDLRKAKFGGFVVETRRIGESGTYKYRLRVTDGASPTGS